jgi:hypothetical protein
MSPFLFLKARKRPFGELEKSLFFQSTIRHFHWKRHGIYLANRYKSDFAGKQKMKEVKAVR